MTGLLSVFSLLPVQALKKDGDGEGEVKEDPGGPQTGARKSPLQDDGESSDKDAERYHCIHTLSKCAQSSSLF